MRKRKQAVEKKSIEISNGINYGNVLKTLGVDCQMGDFFWDHYVDELEEGVDYEKHADQNNQEIIFLTLSGILWAVAHVKTNFRMAAPLIQQLIKNTDTSETLRKQYYETAHELIEWKAAIDLAKETAEDAIRAIIPQETDAARSVEEKWKTASAPKQKVTTTDGTEQKAATTKETDKKVPTIAETEQPPVEAASQAQTAPEPDPKETEEDNCSSENAESSISEKNVWIRMVTGKIMEKARAAGKQRTGPYNARVYAMMKNDYGFDAEQAKLDLIRSGKIKPDDDIKTLDLIARMPEWRLICEQVVEKNL